MATARPVLVGAGSEGWGRGLEPGFLVAVGAGGGAWPRRPISVCGIAV